MPIREITLIESGGTFSLFKKSKSPHYNFSGISALRSLLSNQRAKILNTIKHKNPSSIYDLSKKLNRDFKAVHNDIKLLERFGLIEIVEEKIKNRVRHKPKLNSNIVTIHIKI
jgi:predicted transcriptional regulator